MPKEVVLQSRLTVGILVLQAEELVSAIRYSSFLFQTTPGDVFAEPQEVAVDIGHLSWDAERVVGVVTVKYGTKRSSENIESDLHPFSWTDMIKLLFGFFLRI